MTTQPTQPEAPLADRVSRVEGIVEQINLRLAENADAVNRLHAAHDALAGQFADFAQENARQHAETNARLADTKVDLVKWMVGTMLGVTAIWGGVVYTIVATLS